MLAIVFVPWRRKLAWVRTEETFSADDPWNEDRRTVFAIESYLPSLTGKPVGPWAKDVTVWMTAFTRALRAESDNVKRLMPESLTRLWLAGSIPSDALPRLLKEIQPSLKESDYRATPSSQVPFLEIFIEWFVCFMAVVVGILIAYTAHGSVVVRLCEALGVGGGMLLLGYPSVTLRTHRRRQQTMWLLKRMHAQNEPWSSIGSKEESSSSLHEPVLLTEAAKPKLETQPSGPDPAPLLTLAEFEAEVYRRGALIEAPSRYLPTFGTVEQTARPGILVDTQGYTWIVAERGTDFERFTTTDLDKILFAVFESVAAMMASDYELKHRVEGQDHRRLYFQYQIDLLAILSPEWAKRSQPYFAKVLERHPFDDNGNRRRKLIQDLQQEGRPYKEAKQIADQTYPPPMPTSPTP